MQFFVRQTELMNSKISDRGSLHRGKADQPLLSLTFELYVLQRFSTLELSSVVSVLNLANTIQNRVHFKYKFTSDTAGLIDNGDMLIRAQPAIRDDLRCDCMIVVGGEFGASKDWIQRVRAMQNAQKPILLLSSAATEYLKINKNYRHSATTHFKDLPIIEEIGDYPNISNHLGEFSQGILTCAGSGFTLEATCTLISEHLDKIEQAELSNQLMLSSVRSFQQEQPGAFAQSNAILHSSVQRALGLMEQTIETPIKISSLAHRIGVSPRQLERLFDTYLQTSPTKAYKRIRIKHAKNLILGTNMPLLDIAVACGFPSTSSLSKALQSVLGVSAKGLRNTSR